MAMEPNTEGWSVTYQIWGWVGAALAGAVMWLFGRKPRQSDSQDALDREHERMAELLRKLERAETAADLATLRDDFQKIIGASREGISNKIAESCEKLSREIDELAKRVNQLERDYYRIDLQLKRHDPE